MSSHPRILPMKTAGTQHFIERTYREGGAHQWVRETLINALEANATKIEFGVEWQGVESLGVYRRVIADNGRGMTADELVEFFNTFGGGGKPIGGVHENFGVGAKTSLLPWNHHGVVVISWVDGDPSMIWVQRDPDSGEYGLRIQPAEDPVTGEVSLEAVYSPYYDEEHGCDWAAVKPDWFKTHGTAIILLGNSPHDDTVLGDPNRNESDIKGISSYLNRRLWEVPKRVEVAVDEFRVSDRTKWPQSVAVAHGPQPRTGYDRRTNQRTILGGKYFIEYDKSYKGGKLKASGTVPLTDGTQVDWYLWEGERPAVHSYAAISGYIAALYRNELYDVTAHPSNYRSFGISEGAVRNRLWLVIRPPVLDGDGRRGVYPRTDRNSLLLKGGPAAGEPLPINLWAAEFADQMPDAIREAIIAARAGGAGTITDRTWRERLAERFGARWRIIKLLLRKGGSLTVDPTQPGSEPRLHLPVKKAVGNRSGGQGGLGGDKTVGTSPGDKPAARRKVAGGIPTFRLVGNDAFEDPGMLAAWQPKDPEFPEGAVLLNTEHPVLSEQIVYWQSQYADHHAEGIRDDVLQAYGEIAVSKVAHSEHLKGVLPSEVVEKDLRSDAALTMALLGLIAEEAVLSTRLGGKYGKRRTVA